MEHPTVDAETDLRLAFDRRLRLEFHGAKITSDGELLAYCELDNQRGTAELWIKEGKNAAKSMRPSCRSVKADAVRLQLHALAYNLANVLGTPAPPDEMERWSLTTLREKVVKVGAKLIAHARCTVFRMTEVAVPRDLADSLHRDDLF